MPDISSSTLAEGPIIQCGAFLRALVPPVIVWGTLVLLGNYAGQPGVVCITPMAWLLAFWSGTQYALLTGWRPVKWPLLGPAILGAVLGACLGVIFVLAISQLAVNETDAEEAAKYLGPTGFIFSASILICTLFSTFTAWLTYRRLARNFEQRRT